MNKKALTHLKKDVLLRKVIETTSFVPAERDSDVYSALTRSIVSQQLSVKAAATIYARFLDLFENHYPDAERVLGFSIEDLRSVGLSRQKASYIQNVAEFFLEEKRLNQDWTKWTDEEIIKYLTQIKGVGKWTVEMILMFNLDRSDVLPVDDLGIQQAMAKVYGLSADKKVLKTQMAETARKWQPYRTLACKYLWKWEGD